MTSRRPIQAGAKGVRAAFVDAQQLLASDNAAHDPPPDIAREINGEAISAGRWLGHPHGNLPPGCPVTPLGVDGKTCYFIDTLGQLQSLGPNEWKLANIALLFITKPNFPFWAWPKFSTAKKNHEVNGIEVTDAAQCLMAAAGKRGLFSAMDRVRGRGAWRLRDGRLIWHAGNALFTVDQGKLVASHPGEIEGVFYPNRPPVTYPWPEAVTPEDGPAHEILSVLKSWNFERKSLDPLLVLGWLGCALIGGALDWRPALFAIGDRGVGKSSLQAFVKGVLDAALHQAADTTAAGIYQRVQQDSLPVAIDELEAGADNRRAAAVVNLARLAASGAMMYRGGSDHQGTEFRLINSFFFSSINPPPLEAQDRSRMAIVNLGRLDPNAKEKRLTIDADTAGRMMLRALMDGWKRLPDLIAYWKEAGATAAMNRRAQDTYGTLLGVAHLLIGDEAMEDQGFSITEQSRLGAKMARLTASDRGEETDNWRQCLEHLLGKTIDGWRDGQKPTVGRVIEGWESKQHDIEWANERLALAGLRAREEIDEATGRTRRLLAVPLQSPQLAAFYLGTKWQSGVWGSALKQAPTDVVIRDRGNRQNVKINRMTLRCLLVDFEAYDRVVKAEEGGRV